MASVEGWILAIVSDVIHTCFIIGIVHKCIKFSKHKQYQAIRKRNPLLVQLMSFFMILYLTQHLIYKFSYIFSSSSDNNDKNIGNILGTITLIVYILSGHGVIIMLTAKTWTIYFKTKYALQTKVMSPSKSTSFAPTLLHFNRKVNGQSISMMHQYLNYGLLNIEKIMDHIE